MRDTYFELSTFLSARLCKTRSPMGRSSPIFTRHGSEVAVPHAAVSINGRLCPPEEAAISIWDRGLLYGDGCFEGIRVRDGRLFRPKDHAARMEQSAAVLDIHLPGDFPTVFQESIGHVLRANDLRDAHIRVVVTRGSGPPGLDPRQASHPTTIVMASAMAPVLGSDPLRVIISSVLRKSPRSVPTHVKTLSSLDGILAKQQALAAGADDAIMLDHTGAVAEATAANLFLVRDGEVATPTLRAALPGITRRTVIDAMAEEGTPVVEREIAWGELYGADECFLSGTAAGVVPVGEIDGRRLQASPGPVLERVATFYEEACRNPSLTVEVSGDGRG